MPSIGIMASGVVRTVTNLIINDGMADFEAGSVTGWSVSNATAAASQVRAAHGTWSMALTGTATATLSVSGTAGATGSSVVTGNMPHTLMCALWGAPGITQWRAILNCWDAANASLPQVLGAYTPVTAGVWADCRQVLTTPAGAVRCRPQFQFQMGAAGAVSYLDKIGLFAGDVPSQSWTLPSVPALG